jgi:hypothetical protein
MLQRSACPSAGYVTDIGLSICWVMGYVTEIGLSICWVLGYVTEIGLSICWLCYRDRPVRLLVMLQRSAYPFAWCWVMLQRSACSSAGYALKITSSFPLVTIRRDGDSICKERLNTQSRLPVSVKQNTLEEQCQARPVVTTAMMIRRQVRKCPHCLTP